MKKFVIILVSVLVLGIGYWLISPLFIDKKVSEEFPDSIILKEETVSGDDSQGDTMSPQALLSGSFEGFDSIHYGSGDVKVYETSEGTLIRFEENFNVANGPDLYVGLGKDGEYIESYEIARLKGNVGSQNYLVPENIAASEYNEVWIWCRAFSTPFAKAELN
jgi:hypothetical protein